MGNTEKKSGECREWEGGWKAGGGGKVGDRFVHLPHFASLFNPSYTFLAIFCIFPQILPLSSSPHPEMKMGYGILICKFL